MMELVLKILFGLIHEVQIWDLIYILAHSFSSRVTDSLTWTCMLYVIEEVEPYIGVCFRSVIPLFAGKLDPWWESLRIWCSRPYRFPIILPSEMLPIRILGIPFFSSPSYGLLILILFYLFLLYFSTGTDCYIWMLESSRNFSLTLVAQIFQLGYTFLLFCTLGFGMLIFLLDFLYSCGSCLMTLALNTVKWKLGFHLVSQCRCRTGSESTNHIFLHGSFAQELWRMVAMHLEYSNIIWAAFRILKECVSF